ncbi:hypothetical protein Nepgr_016393 [Nepenthes gracilis]|uniref:Uncharacterized protein n=1 Tax=Nepenthes gracilis TaxID=150966 RepID=A0AAD3SQC4_NEPGR|nr:hypothetical protein Nepgr_016393 [Nepenthes gracilis]
MVLASGISGGMEEPSSVRELTVKAQEVTCVAPVDNSTSRLGLDSQSRLDDAVTTTVPVDGYFDVGSIGVPTEAEMEDTPAVGSTPSSHATLADQHGKDQDRAQIVLGNPMFDLVQIEGFQEKRPSYVECSAVGVDLDLIPNSITRLSSKYSLDDSIYAEPILVCPRGSLDGGWEGLAQDAPRENGNLFRIDFSLLKYATGSWVLLLPKCIPNAAGVCLELLLICLADVVGVVGAPL